MKHDNRGMSLVELVIAIAVSSIIMGVIVVFIATATRSYNSAQNTIDLQMESHVMMEQIGAWIMEGNRVTVANGVVVSFNASGGNSPAATTVNNVLVIYQIPRTGDVDRLPAGLRRDANGNLTINFDPASSPDPITASKRLIWVQDGKLYTKVVKNINNFDSDTTLSVSEVDVRSDCICDYIELFKPSWDSDKETVKINVTLKAGTQQYQLENEFKVRNEIMNTPSPAPDI